MILTREFGTISRFAKKLAGLFEEHVSIVTFIFGVKTHAPVEILLESCVSNDPRLLTASKGRRRPASPDSSARSLHALQICD